MLLLGDAHLDGPAASTNGPCSMRWGTRPLDQISLRDGQPRRRTAVDAAQVYEQALREAAELVLNPGERAPVKVLNSPTPEGDEDSGDVMAGAAWYAGAAFCPGIGQVQGMRHFVEHTSYTGIARAIMQDRTAHRR